MSCVQLIVSAAFIHSVRRVSQCLECLIVCLLFDMKIECVFGFGCGEWAFPILVWCVTCNRRLWKHRTPQGNPSFVCAEGEPLSMSSIDKQVYALIISTRRKWVRPKMHSIRRKNFHEFDSTLFFRMKFIASERAHARAPFDVSKFPSNTVLSNNNKLKSKHSADLGTSHQNI